MSGNFRIVAEDAASHARVGILMTAHGPVHTPVFMPVGTRATVKALTQEMLEALGAEIILANTYHLFLRPGEQTIRELGGLHRFISWPRAILTDSGGFQILSLNALRKVTDDGVTFQSHLDGSRHHLTPERVIEIQAALGSDIAMVLDECIENPAERTRAERAVSLTTQWARRSKDHFLRLRDEGLVSEQQLFGIIQGSLYPDLRERSLHDLLEIEFDGYAIGGLSVGEETAAMLDTVEFIAPLMPREKPRYLMGVGTPVDLIECVRRGVDMFDCVLPTRNARNGQVFTANGPISIKNASYARDPSPLDPACECAVCRRYSRAYVRHLYNSREILASILCTYHNLFFYLDTMKKIRQAIALGNFAEFSTDYLRRYGSHSGS
ncbi:MAG TPA: tRNA guanosine(34) transglycosylase Tgt [Blastocatellia bacterium]|nr:tRNA guanosine(34) transglycosylase Tgt [Blastocatellia bacterium]